MVDQIDRYLKLLETTRVMKPRKRAVLIAAHMALQGYPITLPELLKTGRLTADNFYTEACKHGIIFC